MKKSLILSVMFVFMVMITATPVMAEGPTGTWVSGITCQNLEDTPADPVTFSFYQQGSSTAALTYTDSIPASGTLKYYTPSSPPGLPSSFLGSAVVSSTKQLACSINTQSTGTGTTTSPYRIGASSGFNDGQTGTVLYVPQVTKHPSWNTYMAIQNTTSSDVIVDIQYFDRDTGNELVSAKETYTIVGNSNKVVYPELNSNLPSTFYGSAKISATNPNTTKLAAVIAFYNIGTDYSTSQFHSYSAFTEGAKTIFAPRVVRKYYGYNSGISIQNISGVPTTINMDFTFSNGETLSFTTPTVQPNASYIAYAPNISDLLPVDLYEMRYRSGVLKATANADGAAIVGITNVDNRGSASDNNGNPVPAESKGKGATANMALDGTATNSLFFTQVAKKFSGFSGGIIITNTTNIQGTCDITFAGQPDSASLYDVVLPASGQISYYLPANLNLADGFNAGVKAVCDKAVFGVYNFSIESGTGKYGDSYIETNALNQ